MAYHQSIYLFLFLPLALLAYQLTPQRFRWITLILEGYAFFWTLSGRLVVYLMAVALFTYGIGYWMNHIRIRGNEAARQLSVLASESESRSELNARKKELKKQYRTRQKYVMWLGIVCLLGILLYLKYFNFFASNINLLSHTQLIRLKDLAIPIGISFYTLQAIAYMADVYQEKMPAEQHPGKVALYLGFFPQIMEGPISLYEETAQQLWEGRDLTGAGLAEGFLRIAWGLFKKIIIADRLYVLVAALFDDFRSTHGVMVLVAAVSYTIQLYMEFSGTMDIIIGSGKCFGVTLPENFRRPFFSKSAAEFWRRWHISLGTWFKNYIFYPVSTSGLVKRWNNFSRNHFGRHMKKIGMSAIALFPVWLCNGLWHGSSWSFIFYGMYYFVILMQEIILEPARLKALKALKVQETNPIYSALRVLKTWCIIFTGELFFRAEGLKAGMILFTNLFRDFGINRLWDGTLLNLGLDLADFSVILLGILIVMVVEVIQEFDMLEGRTFAELWTPVRWAVYYGLILAVLVFGAYGIGYQEVDLIYAKF